MKIIFLVSLTFLCIHPITKASDTLTIYYNFSWKEIQLNKTKPDYVGIAWPVGDKWHKIDYTYSPFPILKRDGFYKDKKFTIKNGTYMEYHYNGIMSDSSEFVNGQKRLHHNAGDDNAIARIRDALAQFEIVSEVID